MAPKPIAENTPFYGDNLDILRQYIPDNWLYWIRSLSLLRRKDKEPVRGKKRETAKGLLPLSERLAHRLTGQTLLSFPLKRGLLLLSIRHILPRLGEVR